VAKLVWLNLVSKQRSPANAVIVECYSIPQAVLWSNVSSGSKVELQQISSRYLVSQPL